MNKTITRPSNRSYTQADGTVEVLTPSYNAPSAQVSFNTNCTTGTLAVKVKYHPEADAEVLYDEDGTTPLVIDLTALKSFQLYEKWVYSIVLTPTSVDGTYTPLVASGSFK